MNKGRSANHATPYKHQPKGKGLELFQHPSSNPKTHRSQKSNPDSTQADPRLMKIKTKRKKNERLLETPGGGTGSCSEKEG
jgi:hypothetical protein